MVCVVIQCNFAIGAVVAALGLPAIDPLCFALIREVGAAALLLGAVLAPTDPVLASDVQVGGPGSAIADDLPDEQPYGEDPTTVTEAGEVRFAWYPQTFAVPSELLALRRAGASEPGARWILKDPTLNQGKGVRMLRSLDELGALLLPPRPGAAPPALVVQRNVARPLTVGGYKFHYRLYPLLSSACAAEPRLWIYPHAAARFSTVAYRASAAEKQARRIH